MRAANMGKQKYTEKEIEMIRTGWCIAFNAWWRHKDKNLHFRELEKKLCEALEEEIKSCN